MIPHSYLPFLGHVIGMFMHGSNYFAIVNHHTQHPIFTLQTLNKKTIGVISPQLAAPIQRASKNTSFYGMILEVTKRLVDFDEPSMKVIRYNLDDELGHHEGLMNESHDMVASMLSPGPILNQLLTTQLEVVAEMMNELVPSSSASIIFNLMDFVKKIFTVANAFTIWGPQNPFALHPALVQSFWDYEGGMVPVMADIFPNVTARKPWLARRAVNNALAEFIEKGYYRSASPLIQKRAAINLKHGLTPKMAGRADLILLFGVLGNAVPTTFWVLVHIFSDPNLLARIREETSTAIEDSSKNGSAKKDKVISVAKLKMCPLIISTYRETLRVIGVLASVRLVKKTHTINVPGYRPYLLKKDAMVQIASGVIHMAEEVWGPDAKQFKPERFFSITSSAEQFSSSGDAGAPTEKTATALPKNVPSAAYRAFGGGSVICPGRHFSQTEILGFVALCVHMFDMTDVNGGVVKLPERDNSRIPLSVMKPVKEPRVMFTRRKGVDDVVWRLEL
jgi:cytochrome P450